MSTEIVMPRLSDTMDRGTIAHWNKKTGDPVKRGEVLLEIETDKANMELESYSNGILARIMVNEGESADVGTPIGLVATDEAELKALQEAPPNGPSTTVESAVSPDGKTGVEPPGTERAERGKQRDEPRTASPADPDRIKASPLARRIAQQRGIDLSGVIGTGPGGRIVREDVESFTGTETPPGPSASVPRPPSSLKPSTGPPGRQPGDADQRIPLSRMQRTIATRLTESVVTTPHFYVTEEIDMTHAVRMRTQINEAEVELKVSFNDLVVKAVAVTLRKFRNVNSSFRENEIVLHAHVNIGIAVDLPDGLVVPVVKDGDRKSLREIAGETKELAAAARDGRLRPDQYEGGTFTVSNLGMFGVDQFTAIINPPQSAILAVGAIHEEPAVVDGAIAVRCRMRVTMSCDHRVIYGAVGAAFLAELRRTLEHPVLALV